jgi:alanine racemase
LVWRLLHIGFLNGIPFYAKGLEMLIKRQRYPIVGDIGMNLTMVDITPPPGQNTPVVVGDEVMVIGK